MKKLTTEEIIKRFRKIHGNKYNYDLVVYEGYNKEVDILCPIHGIFRQTPNKHLHGHGCLKCNCGRQFTTETYKEEAIKVHNGLYGYERLVFTGMNYDIIATCKIHGDFKQKASYHLKGGGCPSCAGCKRSNREEFIRKAREIHGDKYDYSKVIYVNNRTPVIIICPIHGEFQQTPTAHLRGSGCPICAGNVNFTQEEYVKKCNEIHNGYYDNSKIVYNRMSDYIKPICPIHGEFRIRADHYIHGHGCKQCNGGGIITHNEFIRRLTLKYGDLYDTSKTEYANSTTPVILICREHGEFKVTPNTILSGKGGCPECNRIQFTEINRTPFEEVLKICREVHGDKYIYHPDTYEKVGGYFIVTCPKHGDFKQIVYEHMHGHGCPVCGSGSSKAENAIIEFLENNGVKCQIKNRKLLDGYEIDIISNEHKIGIEYDGLWWHSEKNEKDARYHINKTENANSKGYQLIHIFEDEYIFHKDLVDNRLGDIFNFNDKIIPEEVSIKEIDGNTTKSFTDEYQIEPFVKSDINYGVFCNDTLIGVASFKREGFGKWRISNLSFNTDYNNTGLFEKIFKQYTTDYNPIEVSAYSDRRWEINKDDNIFTKVGFVLSEIMEPEFYYVLGLKRLKPCDIDLDNLCNKFGLRENIDRDTLYENRILNRIWDCGSFKYIWNNNK